MNRLRLDGLPELRAALVTLPMELRAEAIRLAQEETETAKGEIIAAYPRVTGELRAGVTVSHDATATGARSIVRSSSRYAQWYEYGTARRQTALGFGRGAMPARATFMPIRERHQQRFREAVIALVRQQGLRVIDHGE
jgi:Bacteriophage HK97-gp10, putative tail-component